MTLVDTSVWVDHFRRRDPTLTALLDDGQVACHPFVIGEIALGFLRNRHEVLGLLAELPMSPLASHHDVLMMVEHRAIFGRGVGWVDAHLLTSAIVNHTPLWTSDRRLATIAREERAAWEGAKA